MTEGRNLPSKSTKRVLTETTVEAVLGMVPILGNPLAVAFAYAVGAPISRRTEEWLTDLAADVDELGRRLEDLTEDPAFVDAVVRATRAAQATHDDLKLQALRNAVVNSVGPDAPAADEQARFLRFVDEFTGAHLLMLDLMRDAGAVLDRLGIPRPQLMMGGRSAILEAVPAFSGRRDWYELLVSDLADARLTNHGGVNTIQTGASLYDRVTTSLGDRFLAYITREPGS